MRRRRGRTERDCGDKALLKSCLSKLPDIRWVVTAYPPLFKASEVNTKLQGLDEERNVISGSYSAGNGSGSFFGNVYPAAVPGLTHCRAWTFGRLADLNAAAEKREC